MTGLMDRVAALETRVTKLEDALAEMTTDNRLVIAQAEHDRRAERVMLAGMALMGLLASNDAPSTIEGCSIAALRHADALIAQLDRMEPPR